MSTNKDEIGSSEFWDVVAGDDEETIAARLSRDQDEAIIEIEDVRTRQVSTYEFENMQQLRDFGQALIDLADSGRS